MNIASIARILRKDLRLGPRSPVFLWVLVMPLLVTFLVQVAFGSLFDNNPRLGIVDAGDSSITARLFELDGLDVSMVPDIGSLKSLVESNDLDAGLVLASDFDASLMAGDRPVVVMFVSGEALASERFVLTSAALGAMRDVGPHPSPVEVTVERLGEESVPWDVKATPALAVYALLIAGVFLPAFSLADEREKKTITAVVATPVRLGEMVLAKGLLGLCLALPMAMVTLWFNNALAGGVWELLAVLSVGAVLFSVLGMIYGTASKDVAGVFALIKGTAILLMGPVVFYLFPDWPQWIAKVFPTYWVINPVYRVGILYEGLSAVWVELLIGLAVTALLLIPLAILTKRLRYHLATS